MDRKEIESGESVHSESSMAEDVKSDSNPSKQNIKSLQKDSANNQRNDLGNGSAGGAPDTKAKNLAETDSGGQVQPDPVQPESSDSASVESLAPTDDGDPDATDPVDPDLNQNGQEPHATADESNNKYKELDSNNQNDPEKGTAENASAAENTDTTAAAADTIDAENDPAVAASSSDVNTVEVAPEHGAPVDEAVPEMKAQAPANPGVDDDAANQRPHDSQAETVAGENESAPDNQDIATAAVDTVGAETDSPAESESLDADTAESGQTTPETAEEKSTSEINAEAQPDPNADADENVAGASTPEGQQTSDQKDPAEDLPEGEQAEIPVPQTSLTKIAVAAALIVAVLSGFFIFDNKSKVKQDKNENPALVTNRSISSPAPIRPILDIQSPVTPSVYDGQISEISALRDTLLKKHKEVLTLKQRYQNSTAELEKEILDEQRKADIDTFLQATGNKRIVFRLKTIQRRQAYIRQLEQPINWVWRASEELLYIKRRAILDLQVSAVASGIDMHKHGQQMQAAIQKYQLTADKLAIDPADVQLESLETIWERIQNKQNQISTELAYSKNQIIAQQICDGDFDRLSELSEISTTTAKCITQMHGSDLFLNQIDEISPGAARQLCQWKGSWLCMNGIRALSPRVAHYLFQWGGRWISLNGLTEFPADIGEMLVKWEGSQLELMGLEYSADSHDRIGLESLAQWERSGGKLFVPQNIREKIDALHKQPS